MTDPTNPSDPAPPPDGDMLHSVTAELLNLLAWGQLTDPAIGSEVADIYEGHVVLALDADASLAIVPLHDALTSSPQLFEVAALDHADVFHDASAT